MEVRVDRHKTAITRYRFSKPVKLLLEHNLLGENEELFDFGCGLGDDIRGLSKMGFRAQGWDPVHFPAGVKQAADVVNLGFVLNVIENISERVEVLLESFDLAKKLLIVSSLVNPNVTATNLRPHKDGFLTSRNTFQKYYETSELQKFIEDTLRTSSITIHPGIFFIFKYPEDHHDFIDKRNRRYIDWENISLRLYPDKTERRKISVEKIFEEHRELLYQFWDRMVDLGRIPDKYEFERYNELQEKIGSAQAGRRLFIEKYGSRTLEEAFTQRRNDFLVYLALSNFRKKVPLNHLSKSLQRDIKTFFGSYANAKEQSFKLLYKIGCADYVSSLCDSTGFGVLDEQALYFHQSLLSDLHPVLRIYVGCGELFYGELNKVDIIKIHKRSGKLSLFIYDDFFNNPYPELLERIKIDLKIQKVYFFSYKRDSDPQVLVYKERYVAGNHPNANVWSNTSEKLAILGITEPQQIGPRKSELSSKAIVR